jgi:hypothetical protein
MPPKPKAKQWGTADKKFFLNLIKDNKVDIFDTFLKNIEDIRKEYFSHRDSKNFCRNFQDFAATLDLETKYRGARQREASKVTIFFLYFNVDC